MRKTIAIVALLIVCSVVGVVVDAQQAKNVKDDPYPDFRPCKYDLKSGINEMPYDAPPAPRTMKKDVVGTYCWYINDKTGEFLYRKISDGRLKVEFK